MRYTMEVYEELRKLENRLRIQEQQFKSLIAHFGLVLERAPGQFGDDSCVVVWEFRPVCKECGK